MNRSFTKTSWHSVRGSGAWILAAVLLLLFAVTPVSAGVRVKIRHDERHRIELLEEKWKNAILKQDVGTIGSMLSDDYMAITPSGTLQTKDQALENQRSGHFRATSMEISDRKIRFYGRTAVVTSSVHLEGVNQDGAVANNFRYTRVYVKNAQGEWKIVSFEASKIHSRNGNDFH